MKTIDNRRRLAALGILLVTAVFRLQIAVAQPAPRGADRKESLAALTRIAGSFEVRLDEKRVATREAEPAMRWTNTIGHTTDAALFIWMHGGRPVAAGTSFVTDGIAVGLEFQSLALEPIEARRLGKAIWTPQSPGIEFRPLADAPAPSDTARQRLSQIKALARRFRAQAIKAPPAYQENDARELRLLAQPILQYHDPQMPEREGAIFAFAMDTDADVLLLIENRAREGKAGWEYALARANPYVLKVWCDDVLIWTQKRILSNGDLTQTYIIAGPYPLKDE
ncbi:MAG: hypothetical protein HY290_15350 [Planctomycetia bacterium]|nr:hypothetical protein [Planctomycetia bacterium]